MDCSGHVFGHHLFVCTYCGESPLLPTLDSSDQSRLAGIMMVGDDLLLALADNGDVYESTDQGETWKYRSTIQKR